MHISAGKHDQFAPGAKISAGFYCAWVIWACLYAPGTTTNACCGTRSFDTWRQVHPGHQQRRCALHGAIKRSGITPGDMETRRWRSAVTLCQSCFISNETYARTYTLLRGAPARRSNKTNSDHNLPLSLWEK